MSFKLPNQKKSTTPSTPMASKFHGNKDKVNPAPPQPLDDSLPPNVGSETVKGVIQSGAAQQNLIDWANSPQGRKLLERSMEKSGSNPTQPAYGSPDVQAKKSGFSFMNKFSPKTDDAAGDTKAVREARISNLKNVEVHADKEAWDEHAERYNKSDNVLGTAGQGKQHYNVERIRDINEAKDVAHHEHSHTGDEVNRRVRYMLTPEQHDKLVGGGIDTYIDFEGKEQTYNTSADRLIPKSDVELMKNLARKDRVDEKAMIDKLYGGLHEGSDKSLSESEREMLKFNQYIAEPTETRARLNSGRQSMRELGIDVYNKDVTRDDVQKWINTGDFESHQLHRIYGIDNMVKMFNTISANTDLNFNMKQATNKNINYS